MSRYLMPVSVRSERHLRASNRNHYSSRAATMPLAEFAIPRMGPVCAPNPRTHTKLSPPCFIFTIREIWRFCQFSYFLGISVRVLCVA
jgi:hypothetical protein